MTKWPVDEAIKDLTKRLELLEPKGGISFWIDFEQGNDSNSGLSPDQAFATRDRAWIEIQNQKPRKLLVTIYL